MQNNFSIIMVCKNSEKTIKKSIESFKNQKYPNKSLIVIDGGSIDNTINIIKKSDCVDYFKSVKNLGLYSSINYGIKKCKGDIIGILHSDDLYFDDYVLEKVNQKFKLNKNKIDYLYSDIVFFNKLNEIKRKWKVGILNRQDLFRGKFPPHTGIFVKKKNVQIYWLL